MINVLKSSKTEIRKSQLDQLLHAVNVQSETFEFVERFTFKCDYPSTTSSKNPTRKNFVEPLSILELFLIKEKLKGKKKPIKKKNHDAQQFATKQEGKYYLDATKHFFTNFNLTTNNLRLIPDLKVCKSDLLDNICFVLTCEPNQFFCPENQKSDYFAKTYKSILKKKKIYKIPSVGVIHFNLSANSEIEISWDHSILWFSNPITTLSN